MKTNVGGIDRIVRGVAGIGLIAWALTGGPVWAWIGVVPLFTAVVGWSSPLRAVRHLNRRQEVGRLVGRRISMPAPAGRRVPDPRCAGVLLALSCPLSTTSRRCLTLQHSGEVRGLGAMLAFEFVERTPDRAQAVVSAAAERGLLLLSCGLYGNVIRLLPPLNISAEDLGEGLAILEESLGA